MLDERNILTAAHCFKPKYKGASIGKYVLKVYQERVFGAASLLSLGYRFYPHPDYDDENDFNDLMIINIRKETNVVFSSPLEGFAPDPEKDLTMGKLQNIPIWAEGFGGEKVKKRISLNFLTRAIHEETSSVKLYFAQKKDNEFSIVKGDSGGPIFIERDGVREIIGLTSSVGLPANVLIATWLSPDHVNWIQSTLDTINLSLLDDQ